MNLELAAIRRTGLVTGAGVLVLALVFGVVHQVRDGIHARHQAASAALAGARDQYFEMVRTAQSAADYVRRYETLRARGLVVAERRLNWIEELDRAARELRLDALPYRIEPQKPYQPDEAAGLGLDLRASEMVLTVEVVHEGQWLDLIERLARNTGKAFRVSQCKLDRLEGSRGLRVREPNVRAECRLLWWTLATGEGG